MNTLDILKIWNTLEASDTSDIVGVLDTLDVIVHATIQFLGKQGLLDVAFAYARINSRGG